MQEHSQLVTLQNEIRARYSTLSKRLKQVAQYVLDNHNSVVFDTVATISERTGVPPSTLIRFANAFGFSGFNEMKQIFRENLIEETANYTERLQVFRQLEPEKSGQNNPQDILSIFAQANTQALQQLNSQTSAKQLRSAVEILNNAQNIFIIGLKRSFSIACYLDYALHHLDCRSFLINGLGGMFDEQLGQVKSGDVIVAVSFSPYAKETLEIVNATSQKGVKHIAITDSQISPLIASSDVAFVVKEAQVSGFRSQCATMTLVQTLAILLGLEKEQEKEKSKEK